MTRSSFDPNGVSRRLVVQGIVISLAITIADFTEAQTLDRSSLDGSTPFAPDLLIVAKVLTANETLDPVTASRMLDAFRRADPETAAKFEALTSLLKDDRDADALMEAARAQNLGGAASALIAAWYTGTIGSGAKAESVSYRHALMYAPVSDGMYPPTYAFGGPAWWVEPPPRAGVSPPVEKPAPAPPPVGNPMTAAPPAKAPQ